MLKTRVCTDCGQRKPVDQFYFADSLCDFRRGDCKSCYRKKRKEFYYTVEKQDPFYPVKQRLKYFRNKPKEVNSHER